MKNKIVKILIIISIIILGIGILTAIGIQTNLLNKIISNNAEMIIDGSDFAPLFKIFGGIGTIAISMGIIIITIVTIASLWIIYFIIKGIKKIVIKNGKLSKTRLIIILMIALLLTMGILLKEHNSIHWEYKISYRNGADIYNIYKTNDDKVIVDSDTQPICFQAPCDRIESRTKINFNENNMEIIKNFINSFFNNNNYNAISIYQENLSESQVNILNSIIYNDESLLNKK